jgi:uncharacterized protein (DUF1800 family)
MAATALPPLAHIDPVHTWQPWQPDVRQVWDRKWAAHLYRRAGFGASPTELQAAVERGLAATFDRFFPAEPRLEGRERHLALEAVEIAQGNNLIELRGWWLDRMFAAAWPLREKLTLFWHNHFATSIAKVQNVALMLKQNDLIRRHALGKFRPFLLEMSRDPAMLIWLDSNSNVKGKPNENYARELMELFSLGIGHYTEQDVRQAARAFTGWHTGAGAFTFREDLHDDGTKTVLGQAGRWDGGNVVRIVLEQPACARFLIRKLYRFFISDAAEPPDALLEPLAQALRQSDFEVRVPVEMLLRSRHFFSAYAYRQRVKSPVEFGLGAVHDLGQGFVSPRGLVRYLEAMGQPLFAPPSVKGWEGGRAWLNTATVLARHDFSRAVSLGGAEVNLAAADPTGSVAIAADPVALVRSRGITEPRAVTDFYLDILLQGDVRPAVHAKLVAFLEHDRPTGDAYDQRVRELIHAIMTMPEYQLS